MYLLFYQVVSKIFIIFFQLPQEPTASKTVSDTQLEELRKEASSALHGDTMAYETSKCKMLLPLTLCSFYPVHVSCYPLISICLTHN